MAIKNIIFDFGGVLLDWNPRYFYKEYFNDDHIMEYFLSNICNDQWNAEQDKGRPFSEGIESLQSLHPNYKEPIGLFREKWECMLMGDFPETVTLLKKLKEQKYKIYGLTNWSSETIEIAYTRHNFFELFDGIVVSGDEKCIKPDAQIYNILLDRYKIKAEESVFIDDNKANIEAAKELQFNVIIFDNIEYVRRQLSLIL